MTLVLEPSSIEVVIKLPPTLLAVTFSQPLLAGLYASAVYALSGWCFALAWAKQWHAAYRRDAALQSKRVTNFGRISHAASPQASHAFLERGAPNRPRRGRIPSRRRRIQFVRRLAPSARPRLFPMDVDYSRSPTELIGR